MEKFVSKGEEKMEKIVNQYALLENNGYYVEEVANSDITTDLENINIDWIFDLCDYQNKGVWKNEKIKTNNIYNILYR